MRIQSKILLAALALFAVTAQAASSSSTQFNFLSIEDAERASAISNVDNLPRAWLWSDNNVYMPSDQLNAWWTVVSNANLLPITIVAYRQNNQTGAKSYLPFGGREVTDVFGNSMDDGFMITRVPEAERAPLIGNGGPVPAVTIPNELGMHTLVVEFRDYTGNTVLKRIYWKISVVDEIVEVTAGIESDTTWVRTKSYLLRGNIWVRDSVLTIEDGTIIKGAPGTQPASALLIRSDSELIALGTQATPIIFTSNLPIGNRQPGDWGGVSFLGQALINTPSGMDTLEGLPPGEENVHGGQDDTHSCGQIRYVRVEFAGAELIQDEELNAITFASCGSDTFVEFAQAHYGLDDSFEWFGGSSNGKYLVATGGGDDGLDLQLGWRGKVQFFVKVFYSDNPGDYGIEADNNSSENSAEPFSDPVVYNGTFVGLRDTCRRDCWGTRYRRGLKGAFNNLIFNDFFNTTFNITEDVTMDNVRDGELTTNGVLVWRNGGETNNPNTIEGQFDAGIARDWVTGAAGEAENVVIANPMFVSTVRSDWDLRGLPGSPINSARWELPPNDGFFDQTARCTGSFCDSEDWTEEWTTKHMETAITIP